MSNVKKLSFTAVCIALCAVLPQLLPMEQGVRAMFSPMHLPALLCGVFCGPVFGAVCGVLGPLVSSLVFSMPPTAKLLTMAPELLIYGLASGLLFHFVHTGKTLLDLLISVVIAMLLGRIVGGVVQALVYTDEGGYTMKAWAAAYFTGTLPGIAAHIILVPAIYLALERAKLVPRRYPKAG